MPGPIQQPGGLPLGKGASSHLGAAHLRLAVVLQRHGDDVDADDEGDDQVQVVAGAQRVDGEADAAVRSVVRHLLGLCRQQARERE